MEQAQSSYAKLILRAGLSFVFLWFGFTQLFDQSAWVALIPKGILAATGLQAEVFVIINGAFEICMAALLVFGIRTRVVAGLLALHLIAIIGDLGLTAIAVRDVGLIFALIAVILHGTDAYSLEQKK